MPALAKTGGLNLEIISIRIISKMLKFIKWFTKKSNTFRTDFFWKFYGLKLIRKRAFSPAHRMKIFYLLLHAPIYYSPLGFTHNHKYFFISLSSSHLSIVFFIPCIFLFISFSKKTLKGQLGSHPPLPFLDSILEIANGGWDPWTVLVPLSIFLACTSFSVYMVIVHFI
jgi:hypothetical protein